MSILHMVLVSRTLVQSAPCGALETLWDEYQHKDGSTCKHSFSEALKCASRRFNLVGVAVDGPRQGWHSRVLRCRFCVTRAASKVASASL